MKNLSRWTLICLAATTFVGCLFAPLVHANLDSTIVRRLGPTYQEGYLNVLLLRADGRYQEALELTDRFLDIYRRTANLSPGWRLDCEEGLAVLKDVVRLTPSERRQMEIADSLSLQIRFDWADGRFQEGKRRAENRLAIHNRLFGPDHREVARSLHDLGKFLHALGEIDVAEDCYRRALAIRQLNPKTCGLEIAETLNYLGELLTFNGALREAEQLQKQAFEQRVSILGEDNELVDRSRLEIAQLEIDRGDFASAGPLLREALVSCRNRWGGDHWLNATLMDNLGLVLERQGDYAGAERLYKDVLALRRRLLGEDHPHIARSLRTLGLLYERQAKNEEAESCLREAMERQRTLLGEDHPQTLLASRDLALLLEARGDHAGAEQIVRRVLEKSRDVWGPRHPEVAEDLTDLATILLHQNKLREALPLFEEALDLFSDIVPPDHPRVTPALEGAAITLLECGEPEAARSHLMTLARGYEAARVLAGSGFVRATFRSSPYAYLAAAELELGHETEAWIAAEMGLGRALADLLSQRKDPKGQAMHRDPMREALLSRVGRLERQVSILQASSDQENRSWLEDVQTELLSAEADWLEYQRNAELQKTEAERWGFTPAAIQAAIPKGTAVVGWIDPEQTEGSVSAWGYVVRSDRPVRWVRLNDPAAKEEADLHSMPDELRASLAMASSWFFRIDETERIDRLANKVWELWMRPLDHDLHGVDHLVVLPCEPLLGIPIDALIDERGRYLGERFAISYSPSAAVYAWLRQQATTRHDRFGRKALLVGDPPFSEEDRPEMTKQGGSEPVPLSARSDRINPQLRRRVLGGDAGAIAKLSPLPSSREEIEGIAAVTDQEQILVGPDASEQTLAQLAAADQLRDFDTIHLATHVLVDEDEPERSAFVLSQADLPDPYKSALHGERIFDGLLTLKEIVREWNLDADLVTLSGCQTALGRRTAGEGLIGLQQAFLQVGARNVVLSLWKVDDHVASLLMGRFYENLAGAAHPPGSDTSTPSMSKAESLREAMQWIRSLTDGHGNRPYAHPVYWSGYILVGGDDP